LLLRLDPACCTANPHSTIAQEYACTVLANEIIRSWS